MVVEVGTLTGEGTGGTTAVEVGEGTGQGAAGPLMQVVPWVQVEVPGEVTEGHQLHEVLAAQVSHVVKVGQKGQVVTAAVP